MVREKTVYLHGCAKLGLPFSLSDAEPNVVATHGNADRLLRPYGAAFIPQVTDVVIHSQAMVWDKQHPVLTRKNYMGGFELAFHGWRLGAGHSIYGPNNARDNWYVKKVNPNPMEHLTQKPVELAETAMQHAILPGQNVLDLVGGSGSKLIGAQRTGRRSFPMELDPLYCDVIVDRYQRFTGKPAVLERTSESPILVGARDEAMR